MRLRRRRSEGLGARCLSWQVTITIDISTDLDVRYWGGHLDRRLGRISLRGPLLLFGSLVTPGIDGILPTMTRMLRTRNYAVGAMSPGVRRRRATGGNFARRLGVMCRSGDGRSSATRLAIPGAVLRMTSGLGIRSWGINGCCCCLKLLWRYRNPLGLFTYEDDQQNKGKVEHCKHQSSETSIKLEKSQERRKSRPGKVNAKKRTHSFLACPDGLKWMHRHPSPQPLQHAHCQCAGVYQ